MMKNMKAYFQGSVRTIGSCAVAALLLVLAVAPSAQAAFGFQHFDLEFTQGGGSQVTQAGSHPFAVTNTLIFNTKNDPVLSEVPDETVKDLRVSLPAGLVGRPSAVPQCTAADFVNIDSNTKIPDCSNESAVGVITFKGILESTKPLFSNAPVYNLVPPVGVAQKLGFSAYGVPVVINFTVNPNPPSNVIASLHYVSQPLPIIKTRLTLWGNPANPAHDEERGNCINVGFSGGEGEVTEEEEEIIRTTGGKCVSNARESPYITMPRSCTGPLETQYEGDSWQNPGAVVGGSVFSHDSGEPPVARGLNGCASLRFNPTITAQPTTKAAQSPTGLDFSLDVKDEGLTAPEGLAQSDVRKAVVTLPEGFTTNPSLAEGLNTCSEADLSRETVSSEPGAGCPNESKIGTVEVETPLLDESVNGSLFIAKPYENRFGSLIALYMVIKNPTLGIIIKQPLKVETNPITGQLTTIADEIPQLPFSHFRLHFREGTRSPLASPPLCGTYNATATLYPWSGTEPVTTTSAFSIISGPGASGCPSGTTAPFKPGLQAGTLNNAAGSYSPFYLRLSRNDGEQEFTNFSIKLPPGVSGKLAGVPFCPNASIAAAKARTGPHGGAEELASPSCPKASEVGSTLVGAGVGPSLAYAPGKVYLAGPYNGSSLSIAAITAAKVGPFDLGTVVIREALKINPETAEVFVDATGSDPIPHIIKGIPVHARDIRVSVDKPDFVLNPTSCERTSTASTILGSGTNFASASDDVPVTVTSPFQAADCASLGFAPKLALTLKGGTKRGDTPALKAVLTARKGDANIGKAQVTLPHSEFLEQAHIGTVCTRPQFKAGVTPGEKCPAASVYGYAKAITPLLDEPLQGPVYLRSSSHQLPDLVAALNSGKIDIALAGRIDSVQNGRIRNTFEAVPDAPVTKFTLEMKGGKKGLLVNSTNLCKRTNRAIADFTGQNGKKHVFNPVLKAQGCSKAKKKKAKGKSSKRSSKRQR
jgi:hypothetical protein